jgi:EAL domain-containing protein (putative c-di-GMP-specific phosphodiesterase class I)
MYPSELRDAVLNLKKVNGRLRRAVPKMRGFYLLYQPKVNRKGRTVGAEALLRWDPRCGHTVGPDVFVPAIERLGLIVPVGNWVIEQALAQLAAFRAQGLRMSHVSVNVSARQLGPDFVAFVKEATAKAGATPSDLVLELTESQAVADSGRSCDAIKALTTAGFAWEIDDFGTQYASVRWMRKLAFTGIKLDRSLITATDEPDGLVDGIVYLAHKIGMRVTAEGIETPDQRDRVLRDRVDFIQGFLVGKPLRPTEFISAAQ